ncbi:MAG: right-handed parallel beta-helix repeat-containing protein [Hyphomicrobiales bacterium]
MFIFSIRNFREFSLTVSLAVFCLSTFGFNSPAEALEPASTDQIDGLVDGQTTYGPNGYWKPYVEADGFVWDKAASNGNLRLWSPLIQNPDWIVHTTIGGGFFETDGLQGSAGIGFRHVIGDAILGVYGFTDVTFTENGNTFWRVSPGIELLGLNYEARINGYIPIGEDQYLVGNSVSVGGGGGMSGLLEYETNFLGIDGEIGFRLPVEIGEEKLHDFWLYGGANYYDHENTEELYGADARFEWRINKLTEEYPGSRLSFIANASWNNVDDFDYGGGIRARFPLGKRARCFNRYPDERTIDCPTRNGRMDAAVVRRTRGDNTIVENEILYDPETDVNMLTVVTVNDGDSSLVLGTPPIPGTPSNFNALNDATAATSEVLIVVDGDATPPGGYGAGFVDSDTTVLGTGTEIELIGRSSGTSYQYMVAGARPLFDFGGTGPTLTLDGTGIHIAGLELNASPPISGSLDFNHGLFIQTNPGSQSSNIAIEQNVFSDIAADGINTEGPVFNVRVFNNVFSDVGQDGIEFTTGNRDVTINLNEFGNIGENAIEFESQNTDITIEDNDIGFLNAAPGVPAPIGGDGIGFGGSNSDVIIRRNNIANTVGDGILFLDENDDIQITTNTIFDIVGAGVLFSNANTNIDILNNDIDRVGEEGIRVNGNGSPVTPVVSDFIDVSGNNIFDYGSVVTTAGIWLGNDLTGLNVVGNDIVRGQGSGIRVADNAKDVFIDDNDIWDIGASGIAITSGSDIAFMNENIISNNRIHNIVNGGPGMTSGISLISSNGEWDIDGNRIFGPEENAIVITGANNDIDIVNNLIDGTDWTGAVTPSGSSNGVAFTDNGITIRSGGNRNIRVGRTPNAGNQFSNEIFDVTNYAIQILGTNLTNNGVNQDNEIRFNRILRAGLGGVFVGQGNNELQITNNSIEETRIGVRLEGNANANRGNTNITIQRNEITDSELAGVFLNRQNRTVALINNTITDVTGTTPTNGDAVLVLNDDNTFSFVADNTFLGSINRSVFNIVGDDTDFLSPAFNTLNDASGVAAGAQDCRVTGAGTVGNFQLIPVGGGAVITCP